MLPEKVEQLEGSGHILAPDGSKHRVRWRAEVAGKYYPGKPYFNPSGPPGMAGDRWGYLVMVRGFIIGTFPHQPGDYRFAPDPAAFGDDRYREFPIHIELNAPSDEFEFHLRSGT